MDHHVFRYWPVTKGEPYHYQNQCWFAMNIALCILTYIKRHLMTHFLNNIIKWLCPVPGTSWPRRCWRNRIFLNIWHQNTTNIHRNLQSSAGKRGNIGYWISIIGITVTGLYRSASVINKSRSPQPWTNEVREAASSWLRRETNTSIHRIHQATPDRNFQTVRLRKPAKRHSIGFNQLKTTSRINH